ncbi:glycosyltransferase [Hyphomicrobium sp. ghe19]|uniref:glycosyltransferase n=1 Tax=Hyphomicrobium sp. ghe19 TaxID=2682968 RepID=UPI0013675181|nr:Putative glycosyltransferase EpsE [Hyphomicrobium sp. ghe19]
MAANIDVIMPVKNCAGFVETAVSSVLSDRRHINRLIIIDNGSTDGTADILTRIPRDVPTTILMQDTGGLVAALNRGIEASRSDFIARMDGDDISLPGRLSAQLSFLRQNLDVAAVGTQAEYIDEDGRRSGSRTTYPTSPIDVRRDLLGNRCVLCHPSVLIRRSALIACGGYRAAFQDAEDYDLWLRLIDKYQIANVPDVFVQYRRHEGQVSNGKNLRQSFSRDLALYCSRERRAGRAEPMWVNAMPTTYSGMQSLCPKPSVVDDLAFAYGAVERKLAGVEASLPQRAISIIPKLAQRRYLGENRRARYRYIWMSATAAVQQLDLVGALAAIGILVRSRLSDSRHFKKLACGSKHAHLPAR